MKNGMISPFFHSVSFLISFNFIFLAMSSQLDTKLYMFTIYIAWVSCGANAI